MADNGNPIQQDSAFPDWQSLYHAALLETDPEKLHKSILLVEEAIYMRSQVLHRSSEGDGGTERHAMEDALRALRVIQVEKLKYPEWDANKANK
jgi:hypothetical protein